MSYADDHGLQLGADDRSLVFEGLPTPYVVLTPDLTVVDMNTAYVTVTGRRREDLIGRYFLSAFPPPDESLDGDGRSELQVSLERVRDTGRPDTLPVQKYPIAGADGVVTERHWLAVHVPVLAPDGTVRFIVQRTEDITEYSLRADRTQGDEGWQARVEQIEADLYVRARELADAVASRDVVARQVAILTEASLALASANTLQEVEHIVVGRALPVLGSDGGGIVSPDPNGGWRITTNESLGEHVQTRWPDAPYDSVLPGCWSARTGKRLLLPTRAAGRAYDAEVMTAIYADTGRDAWAFVPLIVGERRLGALAVAWVDERELSDRELALLDGIASQCAQALLRIEIEQAQREAAREVQQLAGALQDALLTPPPEPDHLHVVTRYRPAGHHAQIGGDWYDAFLQPDGATMLVIGDVVGHDSTAAAKMGQLRGVLRTLAYDADHITAPDTPARILDRFDRTTRGLAVDTLATAILARIEQPTGVPGTGRLLRWSNAGHLPPVLVHADGAVEVLTTEPDLLLGFTTDAGRRDHVIDVPDESTLLMFTDGLVERRGVAYETSIAELTTVLSGLADRDVNELCDALLDHFAPHGGEDDVALIAVRAHTEDRPRPASAGPRQLPAEVADHDPDAAMDLPFDTDAPGLARRFVHDHATTLPEPLRHDAELLVSELVTNAVRYGRPDLTLRLRAESGVLGVMVTDRGGELPRLPDGDPEPTALSGRGLLIIAAVADEWGVTRDEAAGGKTVWFELHESSDGSADRPDRIG